MGGMAGTPPEAEGGLPCHVQAWVVDRCQSCHGEPLVAGAPMPLLTWEDMHAPAWSNPSRKVYELVQERVHRTGQGAMPPDPTDRLSPDELAELDAWIAQGAPRAAETGCQPGEEMPATQPDAGVPDPEEDLDCVELRAHGQQAPGDASPFQVASGERYVCFTFAAPWQEAVQGIKAESLIDNEGVLHHWLLYDLDDPASADGSFTECSGSHPNATLLAGWAPGATDLNMPPNVGLEIPYGSGARYMLEMHYYNAGQATTDRSGVRFCATREFREETATVSWLGTEDFGLHGAFGQILPNQETEFTGRCMPGRAGLAADEDIHILYSWPHMHRLGKHMTTVIHRADGGQETLLDEAFSFDYQITYDTPAVVHPGDWLETTCTFHNTTNAAVGYGSSTDAEMCYNFVYAYPAGALHNPGNSLAAAQNTCLH